MPVTVRGQVLRLIVPVLFDLLLVRAIEYDVREFGVMYIIILLIGMWVISHLYVHDLFIHSFIYLFIHRKSVFSDNSGYLFL